MRALSLHQPWASAIASGAKRIETRSWGINARERIAIHAARTTEALQSEEWGRPALWVAVLQLQETQDRAPGWLTRATPRGAVVAIVDLVDCVRVERLRREDVDRPRHAYPRPFTERELGDYRPGRFGWLLENVVRLEQPVPCRGQQGLFELPGHVVKLIEARLEQQRQAPGGAATGGA